MSHLALGEALAQLAEVLGELDGQPPVGTWIRDSDGDLWLRVNAEDWARSGDPYNTGSWNTVLLSTPLEIITSADAHAALGDG